MREGKQVGDRMHHASYRRQTEGHCKTESQHDARTCSSPRMPHARRSVAGSLPWNPTSPQCGPKRGGVAGLAAGHWIDR